MLRRLVVDKRERKMKGFGGERERERRNFFAHSNEKILTIVQSKSRVTHDIASLRALRKKSANSAPSFGEIFPYFVTQKTVLTDFVFLYERFINLAS